MLNHDEMLKELVKMGKDSVIDPSMSEWASPMALVKKKDGNLRMPSSEQCVMSRCLSNATH